ncbi:hypothetical protein BC831DRAFT_277601, partial [Entophlyctis helioformis]
NELRLTRPCRLLVGLHCPPAAALSTRTVTPPQQPAQHRAANTTVHAFEPQSTANSRPSTELPTSLLHTPLSRSIQSTAGPTPSCTVTAAHASELQHTAHTLLAAACILAARSRFSSTRRDFQPLNPTQPACQVPQLVHQPRSRRTRLTPMPPRPSRPRLKAAPWRRSSWRPALCL